MEHSPHNMLVGTGASEYASKNGFVLESNGSLLVPETNITYEVRLNYHVSQDVMSGSSCHTTLLQLFFPFNLN